MQEPSETVKSLEEEIAALQQKAQAGAGGQVRHPARASGRRLTGGAPAAAPSQRSLTQAVRVQAGAATARESGSAASGGDAASGFDAAAQAETDKRSVYVGNVDYEVNSAQLAELFGVRAGRQRPLRVACVSVLRDTRSVAARKASACCALSA